VPAPRAAIASWWDLPKHVGPAAGSRRVARRFVERVPTQRHTSDPPQHADLYGGCRPGDARRTRRSTPICRASADTAPRNRSVGRAPTQPPRSRSVGRVPTQRSTSDPPRDRRRTGGSYESDPPAGPAVRTSRRTFSPAAPPARPDGRWSSGSTTRKIARPGSMTVASGAASLPTEWAGLCQSSRRGDLLAVADRVARSRTPPPSDPAGGRLPV
jgi:hypothetical protein